VNASPDKIKLDIVDVDDFVNVTDDGMILIKFGDVDASVKLYMIGVTVRILSGTYEMVYIKYDVDVGGRDTRSP